MKIVQMPIDDIIPYARNPRKGSNVRAVMDSIREFGFNQPIVVDKNKVIIVGHTRYEAAKRLKLPKCPVLVASKLTKEQAKAYRIMDNKSNEAAAWDKILLALEIDDLQKAEFDPKKTGLLNEEIAKLFENIDEDEEIIPINGKNKEVYQIIIRFKGEKEMRENFRRLKAEGFNCEMLML